MKTAEEWHNSLYSSRHGQCEIITVEELKQIQLDAMKEGMRRMVGVSNDAIEQYGREWQNSFWQSYKTVSSQAILTAAEQLTINDL